MTSRCSGNRVLRKAYTRKGKRVHEACIRRVSPYNERYSDFQKRVLRRMTRRLRGLSKEFRGNTKKCSSGEVLRKAYVRFSKSGKRALVKGACISKKGLSVVGSPKIGPIRKGELSRFGYFNVASLTRDERRQALAKAVAVFGSLSIWKKINVLYVYNKYTNPGLSAKFNEDKNWIKKTYGLKAF